MVGLAISPAQRQERLGHGARQQMSQSAVVEGRTAGSGAQDPIGQGQVHVGAVGEQLQGLVILLLRLSRLAGGVVIRGQGQQQVKLRTAGL